MAYKDPEQQKKYQREWCRARRIELLAKRKCEWCGTIKDLVLSAKKVGADKMRASLGKARIKRELTKHIILCRQCHFKRLIQMRGGNTARRVVHQQKLLVAKEKLVMMGLLHNGVSKFGIKSRK